MKLKNVVVGEFIEAKYSTHGFMGESIHGGKQYLVLAVDPDDTETSTQVSIQIPACDDIAQGIEHYTWTDPKHFRKVKKLRSALDVPEDVQESVQEVTEEPLQVGDLVLVGAEGAGNGYVMKEYAGLTCTVVEVVDEHRVEIKHPDVWDGDSWLSRIEYLTKVQPVTIPKPVACTYKFKKGDTVRIVQDCVAKHGEQLLKGDVCTVEHKSIVQPDAYALTTPKGIGNQVTVKRDKLELVVPRPAQEDKPIDFTGLSEHQDAMLKPQEVQEEPKPLTLDDVQVGDWVVALNTHGGDTGFSMLEVGQAYEVLALNDVVGTDLPVIIAVPNDPIFDDGFYVSPENFTKSTKAGANGAT